MQIKIELPIEPLPQPRARVTKNGTYQSAKIREYKSLIRMAGRAAMDGKLPTSKPVICTIKLYRKFKATSKRFGDLDNLFKSITDALNKIVYEDDSQIVRCIIEKITDAAPKIEVKITDELSFE